jgi:hypothetical protein
MASIFFMAPESPCRFFCKSAPVTTFAVRGQLARVPGRRAGRGILWLCLNFEQIGRMVGSLKTLREKP